MAPKIKSIIDSIGQWSEIKLTIIQKYAEAYSKVLGYNRNKINFHPVYIDAFAGPGIHKSKITGEKISGSPLNALQANPGFEEFHFIDIDRDKIEELTKLCTGRKNVHIYQGDCNEVLVRDIFPKIKYEDFKRALCLLDPYGMQLKWSTIMAASKAKTVELFINFPTEGMNRNVLLRDTEKIIHPNKIKSMTELWGDDSWKRIAYTSAPLLEEITVKEDNITIAKAYAKRLKDIAGFEFVTEPKPMMDRNRVIYYLIFMSHNETAKKIATDIMRKY